jgi:hypothetical protein
MLDVAGKRGPGQGFEKCGWLRATGDGARREGVQTRARRDPALDPAVVRLRDAGCLRDPSLRESRGKTGLAKSAPDALAKVERASAGVSLNVC